MSDIAFNKEFLYDWYGYNEAIFKWVNSLGNNPIYDSLMVLLTFLTKPKFFPLFVIGLSIYAYRSYNKKKLTHPASASPLLNLWVRVISIFVVSFAIDSLIILFLKDYFFYPRPPVALGLDAVNLLVHMKVADFYESFPSGNVSFAVVIVASLWPVLSGTAAGTYAGIALVLAVAWARMAVGMHFPADVLGGAVIGLISVLIARPITPPIIYKLFKWKC